MNAAVVIENWIKNLNFNNLSFHHSSKSQNIFQSLNKTQIMIVKNVYCFHEMLLVKDE